jgi:hypothetical protein
MGRHGGGMQTRVSVDDTCYTSKVFSGVLSDNIHPNYLNMIKIR